MTEEQKQEARGCICMGIGPQVTEVLRQALPGGARDHFRQSRIEFLKGIRSLLDRRIEDLSRPEQRGTTVAVE
jgi:hypothetical protein